MIVAFWVHDMERIASKITVVAAIFAINTVAIVTFAGMLKWI
jgi:hypothetical protein